MTPTLSDRAADLIATLPGDFGQAVFPDLERIGHLKLLIGETMSAAGEGQQKILTRYKTAAGPTDPIANFCTPSEIAAISHMEMVYLDAERAAHAIDGYGERSGMNALVNHVTGGTSHGAPRQPASIEDTDPSELAA